MVSVSQGDGQDESEGHEDVWLALACRQGEEGASMVKHLSASTSCGSTSIVPRPVICPHPHQQILQAALEEAGAAAEGQ